MINSKFVFFLFIVLIITSCNRNEDIDCMPNFSIINVKDFEIGSKIEQIESKTNSTKLKLIDSTFKKFKTYSFEDKIIYNNKKLNISYYFTFYKSILIAYHFDIQSNKETFQNMVFDLYQNKNAVINSDLKKISYFTQNQKCNIFFYLINRADSKLCISGGIEKRTD